MSLFPADMTKAQASLVPTSVTTTGTSNGSAVDLAPFENAVLIHVVSTAPSSGTVTFTVETSDASDSGFAAVDAADLVNPSTGANATFTVAQSGSAVDQTLAIKKQNVSRYIRVVATRASNPTCVFAASVIALRKSTDV